MVKRKLCILEKQLSGEHRQGFLGREEMLENKKIPGWNGKGTIMGSLLLSFHMLATTCIYLQVMVIHRLPEGSRIVMVATVEGGGLQESVRDVPSGSLQPLRGGKALRPILFCLPPILHRGGKEIKT